MESDSLTSKYKLTLRCYNGKKKMKRLTTKRCNTEVQPLTCVTATDIQGF